MDFKLLGSVLLVVGTSIGAGMLGLPIATAQLGFVGSLILLFACWAIMTVGALLLLEVNLWLPQNNNLITMAGKTIGPLGQVIAWISYLMLLYSLLCAYIAGGSDLLDNVLRSYGIMLSHTASSIMFTIIFGSIVYFGIRSVDYVNRGLMLFKFGAFFLLVLLLTTHVSLPNYASGNLHQLVSSAAIMVTVTSFGFATIVPSLRIYLGPDVNKLRKAILIGSLIPLACYILWDAIIMGVIPMTGKESLVAIMQSKNSTSDLVNTLTTLASNQSAVFFIKLFTSICVLTSFLGVSLCLVDFFADGFQLAKRGMSNLGIHALTFIPPLVVVLFFPNVFIRALEYAGINCVVLLVLLPAWMAWKGRYYKELSNGFKVAGGKILLFGMFVFFSHHGCARNYWRNTGINVGTLISRVTKRL